MDYLYFELLYLILHIKYVLKNLPIFLRPEGKLTKVKEWQLKKKKKKGVATHEPKASSKVDYWGTYVDEMKDWHFAFVYVT